VLAEIHQAHRLLEPQAPYALAQVLLGDKALGGVGIRQCFVHLSAAICLEPIDHRRSLPS
jgi:hypothetical protein